MRRRSLVVTAAIGALAAMSGCVGQTEFATDISLSAATFNARGHAGPQGTELYFEYWPSSNPAAKQETTHRQAAPDAAGGLDERVTGLNPGTDYSFRVCGVENGAAPLCAQVRSLRPGADNVQAWGASSNSGRTVRWDQIDLNAFGDPLTGRVFDQVRVTGGSPITQGSLTEANLTCLNVDGNSAVVGFKDPGASGLQNFVALEDNGPAGSNLDGYFAINNSFYNRDPADCSLPLPAVLGPITLTSGDVAIADSEPQPTLH